MFFFELRYRLGMALVLFRFQTRYFLRMKRLEARYFVRALPIKLTIFFFKPRYLPVLFKKPVLKGEIPGSSGEARCKEELPIKIHSPR